MRNDRSPRTPGRSRYYSGNPMQGMKRISAGVKRRKKEKVWMLKAQREREREKAENKGQKLYIALLFLHIYVLYCEKRIEKLIVERGALCV